MAKYACKGCKYDCAGWCSLDDEREYPVRSCSDYEEWDGDDWDDDDWDDDDNDMEAECPECGADAYWTGDCYECDECGCCFG